MVVGLFVMATSGCKGRPSKAECEGLFEHMLELQMAGQSKTQMEMARGMMAAMKPKMVTECVEGMTRDALDCFLAANDSKTAKQCEAVSQKKGAD